MQRLARIDYHPTCVLQHRDTEQSHWINRESLQ